MAVYTPLTHADVQAFLSGYALGGLLSCAGIAEGVENSNFLLETESGKYILTLFEKRVEEADLPYYLELMAHLQARGIHCPKPVADRSGVALQRLAGRPTVIITFMNGANVRVPGLAHMRPLGEALARMHLAAADFPLRRANALSLSGWAALATKIGARAEEVSQGLSASIAQEVAELHASWPVGLPGGAVHADMFPDNVFFAGDGTLTGVIDFYFACDDFWAYDLAICLNAWCFDAQHAFQADWARGVLAGYESVRPLEARERASLPQLARGAALRFLLTRAHDWVFHPKGALVTPKDPMEYVRKLEFFRGAGSMEEWEW